MGFTAPGYLVAAAIAAAGLLAAHFIVRRQPPALALPTARFVPDAPAVTTGWTRVPGDLLVLLLRVLCVLLAGFALARPSFDEPSAASPKVILVDRSRAIADTTEVLDSVARLRADGDVVISYASRAFQDGASPTSTDRGSLSAGLVAAVRSASRFRGSADSVELVIVSSFAAEQVDAATARLREEWPGRARLVRVSGRAMPPTSGAVTVSSGPLDPMRVALAAGRPATPADVRIIRDSVSGADSAWAAAGTGRVLVHWPRSSAPAGFVAVQQPVRAGGVVMQPPALIANLVRRWQHVPALGSNAIAWWIDGGVAASESAHGGGCVRSVAIPVSASGDFVLRADLHELLRELVQACGGEPAFTSLPPAELAMLAGRGGLAPAASFAQDPATETPLTKWLLLASLACALLELAIRGRHRRDQARETVPYAADAPSRKVA